MTRRWENGSELVALVAVVTVAGCSAGNIDVVELAPGALFEGLIAHWTFDDGAGTTLADSTTNKRDGIVFPGAIFQTADAGHPGFGGFLRFYGSPMSEVDVPGFPKPTGSWSVAGWIRAPGGDTGVSYATIISTEVPNVGGWQLNLELAPTPPVDPKNTTSLYQYAFSKGTAAADGGYNFGNCECFIPNAWVHIAGVFDADMRTILIFHNGILAASAPAEQNILAGTDILYFGRWGFDNSRRFTGELDDFVIYNRALTQPEIQQLTRAPIPNTPPP